MANRHFVTDTAAFRKAESRSVAVVERVVGPDAGQYRRFSYNPLAGRPLVTGFGPGLLCPSPGLLWRKVNPAGIYHTGLEHFGPGFLQETGYLFEEYIGRQLRLLPDADVLSEITYTVGKNERQSVDWIVVFDDLVVLVEVKSMMPTESVRLGLEGGVAETDAKLSRAYRQVNTTHELIESRHPAFIDVPTDRPRQALVVTLEPFPVPNAALPHLDLPTPNIPLALTSVQEIERLVTITDITPSALLLARAADPERSTWALNECLTGHSSRSNPVLDQGWASYPWAAERRLGAEPEP